MAMSEIDFMFEVFKANAGRCALIWRDQEYTYGWLLDAIARWEVEMEGRSIGVGSVVVLDSDYTPTTTAVLLALIARRAITAPLLPATVRRTPQLMDIVSPSARIAVDDVEHVVFTTLSPPPLPHPLIATLHRSGDAGLILFTSGSTGEPKAVVHDFSRLLRKFKTPRPALRTLNFLLFDHWGGLNTLLHSLSNASTLVLPEKRVPEYICALLERHRVELLPASPTFLNLLLLSKSYKDRDLSALRIISYGSEPMLPATLRGLRAALPHVELRQTYGLIELGVLRTKSESSDSLWVKMGGEGYDLRVVGGLLEIKAESAMLGYLNAPAPFTDDGYFKTGDRVEINGDYLRILGRESELINVGGQKVFPAEVESVLLECEAVSDAVVYGMRHPLIGSIVCADVRLAAPSDERDARIRIKKFCAERLDAYKVPVNIRFVADGLHSDRLKRLHRRP